MNKVIAGLAAAGCLLAAGLWGSVYGGAASVPAAGRAGDTGFGDIPLYFIASAGQADGRALFYARTPRYTLWLSSSGLIFDALRKERKEGAAVFKRDVSEIVFKASREEVRAEALDPSPYIVSRFEGNDESLWTTGIPSSRAVLYRDLYPGIDLKVYGVDRQVEYDWIVRPGANPAAIRLEFRGVRKPGICADGTLIVKTAFGDIRHRRPVAYQEAGGRRVTIEAGFKALDGNEFGFELGPYDPRLPLVIDPVVLTYATYLGGDDLDEITAIAADSSGAIYCAGISFSADFPAASSGSNALGYARVDNFVTKLSADGRSLVYTAFFPIGQYMEGIRIPDLAVDGRGSAYLVGSTTTKSFPVKNAIQKTFGGGPVDGFVLKLAPSGRSLVYSSYLGGGGWDATLGIAVDGQGEAFVAGLTGSNDIPIKKAYQQKRKGDLDIFVSKLSADGRSLVFSTFLGGSDTEAPCDIGIDGSGAAYVFGSSDSSDFPLKSAVQKARAGREDFVLTKFSPDGRSLVYSTFLGGVQSDIPETLAVDASGAAVVVGYTSSQFPVKNAFQPARKGAREGVVAKFAPDGKSLIFSTFLGGTGDDSCLGVAADADGRIFVSGFTESRNFPKKKAIQSILKGRRDAFLAEFDATGRSLLFSTYLGGSYRDQATRVCLDSVGRVYLAGITNSLDFPVQAPFQGTFGGGFWDAFIARIEIK
jgi:hypothetical protein